MRHMVMAVMIFLVGCSSDISTLSLARKKTAWLEWTAGRCADNFLLYQQVGNDWVQIGESTTPPVKLPTVRGRETNFTVAGVCQTGDDQGVWRSQEFVTVR